MYIYQLNTTAWLVKFIISQSHLKMNIIIAQYESTTHKRNDDAYTL